MVNYIAHPAFTSLIPFAKERKNGETRDSKIEVKNTEDNSGIFYIARKLKNKQTKTIFSFINTTNQTNQLITVMLPTTEFPY